MIFSTAACASTQGPVPAVPSPADESTEGDDRAQQEPAIAVLASVNG
jgi:hypothetical protein